MKLTLLAEYLYYNGTTSHELREALGLQAISEEEEIHDEGHYHPDHVAMVGTYKILEVLKGIFEAPLQLENENV